MSPGWPLNVSSPDQLVPFLSGPGLADGGANFAAVANADYDAGVQAASAMLGTEGCPTWLEAESSWWPRADVVPFANTVVQTFGNGRRVRHLRLAHAHQHPHDLRVRSRDRLVQRRAGRPRSHERRGWCPVPGAAETEEHCMSTLRDIEAWIDDRLPVLASEHGVPGAAVAVLADGEMIDAATGVLSLATGVEATPDSVFQIGSITKLWTATLVMQLVDEGRLDLDQPVRRYLPGVHDRRRGSGGIDHPAPAAQPHGRLRGRHLHRHGQGRRLPREVRPDARRHPPALPARRALLVQQRRLLRARSPRRGAAREALRRLPARAPLHAAGPHPRRQRPLRGHPVPRRGRATCGRRPDADLVPAPVWALARSNAPAGSMLAMRPRDLLTFAQMHMDAGRAADGTVVLQPETVRLMHEPQRRAAQAGAHGRRLGPRPGAVPDARRHA